MYDKSSKSTHRNFQDRILRRGNIRCTMSRQNQLIGVFPDRHSFSIEQATFCTSVQEKVFYGIVPVKFTNSQ